MKDRVVLAVLIVLAVLSAAAFARTVDWGGWGGHRYSALNLGDGIVAVFDKQAGRVRACSPGAVAIFAERLDALGAAICDRPPQDGTRFLIGHDSARHMLGS